MRNTLSKSSFYKTANLLVVMLFILISKAAYSQTTDQLESSSFQAAEIERKKIAYFEASISSRALEIWFELSTIVTAEGVAKDVVFTKWVGPTGDQEAFIEMFTNWKFKPASLNGVVVEQAQFTYKHRFGTLARIAKSLDFTRKYEEVEDLIIEEELELAQNMIPQLLEVSTSSYEWAWSHWLNYSILERIPDSSTKLKIESLKYATLLSNFTDLTVLFESTDFDTHLGSNEFAIASQNLATLSLNVQDYSGALETINNFRMSFTVKKSDYYLQVLENFEKTETQINNLIASKQIYSYQAEIDSEGILLTNLLRSNIGFSDLVGEVEYSEIRCEAGVSEFVFVTEQVITIPESWRTCQLLIKGSPATSLVIYEYPAEEAVVN